MSLPLPRMRPELPSPGPVGAVATFDTQAPPRRERNVGLRCDDLPAGLAWGQLLGAEGLRVQAQPIDDPAPTAADALVLHIGGRLTDQLPRLRALRAQAPHTPLLVALHGMRELDQVLALEMGADDVIDTCSAAAVTAARLRALWRRSRPGTGVEPPSALRFGRLELLLLQRQARWADQPLPLSEGEFEVLWLLASQAGHAVSRRELLRAVRGLDDHPLDRSIDNRVYRIRAKLGDAPGALQRIRTVRNHGYVFCPQGW